MQDFLLFSYEEPVPPAPPPDSGVFDPSILNPPNYTPPEPLDRADFDLNGEVLSYESPPPPVTLPFVVEDDPWIFVVLSSGATLLMRVSQSLLFDPSPDTVLEYVLNAESTKAGYAIS